MLSVLFVSNTCFDFKTIVRYLRSLKIKPELAEHKNKIRILNNFHFYIEEIHRSDRLKMK